MPNSEQNSNGFPLAPLFRRVAEGHLQQAGEYLEAALKDIRLVLDGKERTTVFKPETDPVDILVGAVRQQELCRTVIKLDDEARKGE